MRAVFVCFALVAVLVAPAAAQDGATAPARPGEFERVDRILAIVDEDPILESDLEQALGLGLVVSETAAEAGGEADGAAPAAGVRRRVLDRLIDERLRFHEIDRFGFTEIPLDEVDRGYRAIRDRFESEASFAARLEELGLDPEGLRQLVARQIMVLTYVEERLGSRVFVSLDDIRRYYAETFEPAMKANRQTVPPLPDVREEIRAVLRAERLNEEIDRWTDELRIEADVDDFLDSPLDEIPPHLIDTIEASDEPGRR